MSDLAAIFKSLHAGPIPLRLVNAWDPLSARSFELAGAPAVGTSSFAVALARGYPDGQQISARELVDAAAAIVSSVDVPVTVDIEAGYGPAPADVERLVGEVIGAGAVGINLEDGRPDAPGELFSAGDQCRRIAAARHRADADGVELFVNARSDVYFGAQLAAEERRPTALGRLRQYVDAGADGVFLPGLTELDVIAEVASTVPVPLNVMLWPNLPPFGDLAAAGVRRLSQGGSAFLQTVGYLAHMTTNFVDGEDPSVFGGAIEPGYRLLPGLARPRRR